MAVVHRNVAQHAEIRRSSAPESRDRPPPPRHSGALAQIGIGMR